MLAVSVVIIAKNEAENIGAAVISAKQITDDIIVADSGSTDDTYAVCNAAGANVVQIEWKGFGAARNEAANYARHDWVFALDADERIDEQLAKAVLALQPENQFVYGCKRRNFLYNQPIRYGEWGRDVQYRLYNRKTVSWHEVPVHESLNVQSSNKKKIDGALLHLTMKDRSEYEGKVKRYAELMAKKYFESHVKSNWIRQTVSPIVSFVQNYIFRLGFLDGQPGLEIALMAAKYTGLKYKFLRALQQQHKN